MADSTALASILTTLHMSMGLTLGHLSLAIRSRLAEEKKGQLDDSSPNEKLLLKDIMTDKHPPGAQANA